MSVSDIHRRVFTSDRAKQDLRVLDALAGQKIGGLRFHRTSDEVKQAIHKALPLFIIPIGTLDGDLVGVHARPEDVAAGRTAIISEGEPGYMEEAASIADAVFFQLAFYEIDGTRAFRNAVEVVNSALGPDFYKPGALGTLTDANVRPTVAARRQPWEEFYVNAAVGKPRDEQLRLFSEAVKHVPSSLCLYAWLSKLHVEAGDDQQAAAAAASGLDSLNHTAFSIDVEEFYDRARQLATKVPAAFTDRHRRLLAARSDKERMVLVAETLQEGDAAWSAKLLCDVGNEFGFYNEDPMPMMFRKQFEKLGWAWALELLSLR